MAAAHEAEAARLNSGVTGPSPLSGKAYDFELGDSNLNSVAQLPLDLEIEGLVDRFRDSGQDERQALRQSLSLKDNYTLIQFAKRAAVRVLNQPSPELCEMGLMALAMIDETRIDPRDASWAAGLLNHAAGTTPDSASEVFQRASAAATPGMGELLLAQRDSTLEDWGYRVVKTAGGIGLVRCWWAPYNPTVDLADLATRVGEHVLASRYVVQVTVATELPSIWFDRSRRKSAEETLARALGVAQLTGRLRRALCERPNQIFSVWIVEMPSAGDCARLVSDVGSGTAHEGRFVVAVTTGRLFVLLVGGSAQQGVEPCESPSTLADLAERVRVFLSDGLKGCSE